MSTITVFNWDELNDKLFEDSWKESLGRFRSNYAFRGLDRSSMDLGTSLMKLGEGYEKREGHLLRNFRKYAYGTSISSRSTWDLLAAGQHHGLPTRLLDWTYSPYVALHFATSNLERFDCDSTVWCVDYVQTNQLMPEALKKVLEEEDSNAFTADMLDRVAKDLDELGNLSPDPFVVFLEPPSLDERIVNQFALFSIMSCATTKLDDFLSGWPDLHKRIIIPAKLKWEIRDKLDQANITERVLFPGLDGLSSWLKRYYSLRPR